MVLLVSPPLVCIQERKWEGERLWMLMEHFFRGAQLNPTPPTYFRIYCWWDFEICGAIGLLKPTSRWLHINYVLHKCRWQLYHRSSSQYHYSSFRSCGVYNWPGPFYPSNDLYTLPTLLLTHHNPYAMKSIWNASVWCCVSVLCELCVYMCMLWYCVCACVWYCVCICDIVCACVWYCVCACVWYCVCACVNAIFLQFMCTVRSHSKKS